MDFKISDDGTLIRYSGAGGDVVLPEGVKFIERFSRFDHADEITSLTLPKSFIGRKFEIYNRNGFVYNAQDNSVSNCFVNKRLKEHEANQENLYSYLYLPWLRNLERYIVHPQNPIYESVEGVLYSKCRRFVIGIPKICPQGLTLQDGFEKVLKAYDSSVEEMENVKYMGTSLSTEQLDEIARLCGSKMQLFAPNLTHCDLCKLNGRWDKRKKRITAIMPELGVSKELVDSLGFGLVLGYCQNRQSYSQEICEQYVEMMLRNEMEIYNWAILERAAPVLIFYREEWSQKRLPKIDISTRSGLRHYLFEIIVRGSVQDLQELFDKDTKVLRGSFKTNEEFIDVLDYAIALTTRYGGIEKLRVLLAAADKEFRRFKSLPVNLSYYSYDLWVTGRFIFYNELNFSALAISPSHEVRSMKPVSENERLECLKLLSKKGILNIKRKKDSSLICFLALLCGDFKIADYMISHGANLQIFMGEDKEYLEEIDFDDWLLFGVMDCQEGVVKLIELSSTEENRFAMPHDLLLPFLGNGPNEFAQVFNLIEVKTKDVVELFENALEDSFTQAVHAIATSNQIRSRQTLSKLLHLATKYKAHEATAILLERQQEFQSKAKTTKTSRRSSLSL